MASDEIPPLFTVNVIQVPNGANQKDDDQTSNSKQTSVSDQLSHAKLIEECPNMVSARVIGNNMVEFQHSNLVGPAVKFKTVVNYNRLLEPSQTLGIYLTPQDTYKVKTD